MYLLLYICALVTAATTTTKTGMLVDLYLIIQCFNYRYIIEFTISVYLYDVSIDCQSIFNVREFEIKNQYEVMMVVYDGTDCL